MILVAVVSTTKIIDKFSGQFKNMITVSVDSDEDIKSRKYFQSIRSLSMRRKKLCLLNLFQKIASIMYTTGTTGESKGVMLSHKNVVCAINNICDFVGYDSDDKEVVVLPLSHNFGLGHIYCNLKRGGSIYTEHGLIRVNSRVLKKLKVLRQLVFQQPLVLIY